MGPINQFSICMKMPFLRISVEDARIEAASGAWNARSEGLHGADQVNLQLPSSKRLKVIG
jgi:hypothetical protein